MANLFDSYETYCQNSHRSVDEWVNLWEKNAAYWHENSVTDAMKKCYNQLSSCQFNSAVFVPLCGKSLDMIWLAKRGHKVIGVEISSKACKEFMLENEISHEEIGLDTSHGNIRVFKTTSKDLSIVLYCSNFFNLYQQDMSSEMCNAVWDCGSFIAMNPVDREKYAAKLLTFVKPGGIILLQTYEYDLGLVTQSFSPFLVFEKDIFQHFGRYCKKIDKIYTNLSLLSHDNIQATEYIYLLHLL